MAPPEQPEWLTKEETATHLGVSPRTIGTWVITGRFPAPTTLNGRGNRHYWSRDDITAFEKERDKALNADDPQPPAEDDDDTTPPGICAYHRCSRPQRNDSLGLHLCSTHTKNAHTILNRRKS